MASIRLDPELEAQVRRVAARKGLSMSEVHRQALKIYVESETSRTGRFSDVIGIAEGDADLSTRVAEIFAEIVARD
ncbi:hypothetical protein BH24DEI2_BH24DEI2_17960 [soil metagenome]